MPNPRTPKQKAPADRRAPKPGHVKGFEQIRDLGRRVVTSPKKAVTKITGRRG